MKLEELFQYIQENELSYIQMQDYSDLIDKALGYEVYRIEKEILEQAIDKYPKGNKKTWGRSLFGGSEAWIGLHPKQLQTTYSEILSILKNSDFNDSNSICDLGAGYGRIGVVVGLYYKLSSFYGIELVKERVLEGLRVFKERRFEKHSFICENLRCINIPVCDYYFIYDFGVVSEINYVLDSLSLVSEKKKIKVIARGRGVISLIENKHTWLTIFEPKIFKTYSIFLSHDPSAYGLEN